MSCLLRFTFLLAVFGALAFRVGAAPEPAAGASDRTAPASAPVLELDKFVVEAARDDVGLWPEEKPDVFPFQRTGIFSELENEQPEDTGASILKDELTGLSEQRQAEFVSVSGGSTPRGFTAPRLRNGLTQLGFPEQIVGGRRDLLTGFMAVLYGRTAPGGIVNLISRRPTPKTSWQFDAQASSRPSLFLQGERSELIITRRLNARIQGSGSWQEGPQDFARREEGIATVSMRYAPDKKTILFWEVEAARTNAVPAPGMPSTREVPGGRIGAPYVPLATFSTNGPHVWSRRESYSTSLWAERKIDRGWVLRGGTQWWSRTQRELRFSTGPYVLSTGRFDGTREPFYSGRTDHTAGAQVEADIPVKGVRLDQRWLAGLEGSRAFTDRERRALPTAVRNALPVTIRSLDPAAPDFSLPAYSVDVYARLQTLRDEEASYAGAFISDRVSWDKGRQGATFGLRQDWVSAAIDDRLPNAKIKHASAFVQKTTYHAGWVGQFGNGLAVFANHSTAFQPQRRIDARTGQIQGNENTSGIETGLRWATLNKRLVTTAAIYRLWNQNITRHNPAYDDPVLDSNRTQPQLVSSGEEQFTGLESSVRWNVTQSISTVMRGAWLEATTTSSPDLPEEVGRQLPRTPKFTGSASATWRGGKDGLGWQLGTAFAWIGSQVSVYQSATRARWRNGGYGVMSLNSGYTWATGKLRHSAGLGVRNVLDRDLVAAAARIGGERSLETRYGLRF